MYMCIYLGVDRQDPQQEGVDLLVRRGVLSAVRLLLLLRYC